MTRRAPPDRPGPRRNDRRCQAQKLLLAAGCTGSAGPAISFDGLLPSPIAAAAVGPIESTILAGCAPIALALILGTGLCKFMHRSFPRVVPNAGRQSPGRQAPA